MKLSRSNTESYRRKIRRLRIFDALCKLRFLDDRMGSYIRETRYKPCPAYNLFKNVIQ